MAVQPRLGLAPYFATTKLDELNKSSPTWTNGSRYESIGFQLDKKNDTIAEVQRCFLFCNIR